MKISEIAAAFQRATQAFRAFGDAMARAGDAAHKIAFIALSIRNRGYSVRAWEDCA